MLMGLAALAAIVVALCCGGSLRVLASVRLTGLWLMPLALVLQVIVVNVLPGLPQPIGATIHLLSYALAALFLARNIAVPGISLIAIGTGLNAVAITANRGVLPASPGALKAAGWDPASDGFANSSALTHPHLAVLGDNYVTPDWVPLANVFSLGDVIIAIGAVVFAYHAARRTPRHRASRRVDFSNMRAWVGR